MPKISVAYPHVARYAGNPLTGKTSYSLGQKLARMVKMDLNLNAANDNDFFADGVIAESDDTFQSGSVKLETAELHPFVAYSVMGTPFKKLAGTDAITGITDPSPYEFYYGKAQNPPFLGLGFVVTVRYKDEDYYQTVVFPKIKFGNAAGSVNTRGKNLEWQTENIEAKIYRDDTDQQNWKVESGYFTTMAQALIYLRHFLNIEGEAKDPEEDMDPEEFLAALEALEALEAEEEETEQHGETEETDPPAEPGVGG